MGNRARRSNERRNRAGKPSESPGDNTRGYEEGSDHDRAVALREVMQSRRTAFIERFGREPGPDDPVFFDPDIATPTSWSEDSIRAALSDAEQVRASGLDPVMVRALLEVGYVVSDENRHLFSPSEVQAFLEAYERHS